MTEAALWLGVVAIGSRMVWVGYRQSCAGWVLLGCFCGLFGAVITAYLAV